ncbi:hypothetical protein [Nakamurella leprariae]|uniref:Uncharacterized protein n=1 Tax=Nakamurella leprariae TaxID=2803911 RepID=A0A939C1E3_9ACTN|nr:hypothetical protein [Nakamurella leprariae]MBM9467064.1 hypothetical protein [Nakamurella leprariae]
MSNRRHGRGRRQPVRRPHPPVARRPDDDPQQLELFQSLRRALRAESPLPLLATVSGLLDVTDTRHLDQSGDLRTRPALDELVGSFIGTSYAETTAALTVLQVLIGDGRLAGDIHQELNVRRHPLPTWLAGLSQARLEPDVWSLTHVLGDGDDYLFGATLPTGHPLSVLVYVDHNLGSVVKDAFVVDEPLEDLVIRLGSLLDGPDQVLVRTDPATVRATVESAIDMGVRTDPLLDSETWPAARPLVEWMVRMLPAGGSAPTRRTWSWQDRAEIATDFFASEHGRELDGPDQRIMFDQVLRFTTEVGTGDPWRWSAVTVEMVMADWLPRTVFEDEPRMRVLPDLLRAWITACHLRNGVGTELTAETLSAVDECEPVYLELISGSHRQLLFGAARAIAEAERVQSLTPDQFLLEYLAEEVGGPDALRDLDDEPLPDEAFDWDGVDAAIEPKVRAIIDACDTCAAELLDVEHRTAMRRLVARAVAGDPALFRRRSDPLRGAAAVAWAVTSGNRTAGAWSAGVSTRELLAHFGVSGSVSDRARTLLRAAGVADRLPGPLLLRDATLLVSSRRAEILRDRDQLASGT